MRENDSGKSREKSPKRSTPPSTATCQTRASCFMTQTSRYPCYEHYLIKMDSLTEVRIHTSPDTERHVSNRLANMAATIPPATREKQRRERDRPTKAGRAIRSWYSFALLPLSPVSWSGRVTRSKRVKAAKRLAVTLS